MARRRRYVTGILVFFVCCAVTVSLAWRLTRPAPARVGPAHAAFEGVVPVVRFKQTPLERVLRECEQLAGVPIVADWDALRESGVTRDTPVTLHRYGDRLADVLRAIARRAADDVPALAVEADDDRILLGKTGKLPARTVARVYHVGGILRRPSWLDTADPSVQFFASKLAAPQHGQFPVTLAPPPTDPIDRRRLNLTIVIQVLIAQGSWKNKGGALQVAGDQLLVVQTSANQHRVEKLLADLNPDQPFQCEWPGPCAADAAWLGLLARQAPADLRLDGLPFERALDHLRETFRANIELEEDLEFDARFDRSRPITLRLRRPTLEEAVSALGRYVASTGDGIGLRADGNNGLIICDAATPGRFAHAEFYDVRPILGPSHSQEQLAEFLRRLTAEVAPDTWVHRGGHLGLANRSFEGRAIIHHTRDTHRLVRQWLDARLAEKRHQGAAR